MNLYDKAHELAKALKNSDEYCSFLRAKQAVDKDETAKKNGKGLYTKTNGVRI